MSIKPEDLTRTQVEKILNKWGTKAKLAEIKKNPVSFYEKEGIKHSHKTNSLASFVAKGLESGIREWDLKDFKKYTGIAASMLRASTSNLNVLRATFSKFKNLYRKHHSEDDARYKSLKYTMSLTPEENATWVKDGEDALSKKTTKQVVVSKSDIKRFIEAVAENLSVNIVDKIIICQISSGARLIEILSKNVSKFVESPRKKNIRQIGTAKSAEERVVEKPLIGITPKQFLQYIKDIRNTVKDDASNVELTNMWNSKVNKRIRQYWEELGIKLSESDKKQIGNSHGLRKMYVNLAFLMRKDKDMSKQVFISRYLGHKSDVSKSAINYDSIHVSRKKTKKTKKTEEKEPKEKKTKRKKSVAISEKQKKFARIEKLLKAGKSSYKQMQDNGVSTYMYSMYRKEKGLAPPTRTTPSKSVAEVAAELKKDGKSPTYANLRAAGGFTNAQIKKYKDSQK